MSPRELTLTLPSGSCVVATMHQTTMAVIWPTMAPAMAQSEGTGRPLGIDDVRLPIALATVFLIVRQIYASWAVEQPDDTDFFGELDYRGDDRSGY